jgi:beta-glucanase (GH16 family)
LIKFSKVCIAVFSFSLALYAEIVNPAPPPGFDWIPIPELTDEFDGAVINSDRWDDHNPSWKGRPPGLFSNKNVSQKEGFLTLQVRAETLPESMLPYRDYTTAAVKSKHKVMYGYFEVRAKPMKSRVVSGFWFYDSTAEHWTEIDVFELAPGARGHEKTYHMNAHVFRTPTYQGTIKDHIRNYAEWIAPYVLSNEFHVYGLEWDEKKIKWYVDGRVVRELDNQHWHYPLHMNFNTETNPDWLGLPGLDELPGEYLIDYVRSWRKNAILEVMQ